MRLRDRTESPQRESPRRESPQRERFAFVGEQLALDFANTLGGYRGGNTRELIATYDELVEWGQQAGIVTPNEAQRLLHASRRDPAGAATVLERAHLLREAIYALVVARMHGEVVCEADFAVLNGELAPALAHRRVTTGAEGVVWTWDWREERGNDGDDGAHLLLDALLWPAAVAAAELLVMRDHLLLRECASDRCSWLFLDTTRNHSRRWCDMKGCGNQAKIQRYRSQHR